MFATKGSSVISLYFCLICMSSHASTDWPMDFEAWRQLFPPSESVERVMKIGEREMLRIKSFQESSLREQQQRLDFTRSVVQDSVSPPTRNAEVLDLISAELTRFGWKASILGFAFPDVQTIFNLHVVDPKGNLVFEGHIGELGLVSHHVLSHQFEITNIQTTRSIETARFLAAIATRALPKLPSNEDITVVESVIENYLRNGILANIGVNKIDRQRLRIEGFLDWRGSPILDRSRGLIPTLTFFPNSIGEFLPFQSEQRRSFQLYGVGIDITFSTSTNPRYISLHDTQILATQSIGPGGPTLSISPYSSSVTNLYVQVSQGTSGEPLQSALARAVGELHEKAGSTPTWHGMAEGMAGIGHAGYRRLLDCRNLFN